MTEGPKASEQPGTPQFHGLQPVRRRVVVLGSCLALAATVALVGWSTERSSSTPPARSATPSTAAVGRMPQTRMVDPPRSTAKPVSDGIPVVPPGYSLVARMKASFPGYYRPGGPVKVQVPAKWQTIPSMLAVVGQAPGGWLHVRLAQRPDQSTAWIHASDAILATTPYRIVVNLTTTHLQLYKVNRLVLNAPVGVGAPDTPTPPGHYFVAFVEPPISPAYGPFIMITSAHSEAIADWAGTGDAIIGIHGPVGADAAIGTAGAHISNGCVRMHDSQLLRLEDVPPGSPIDIVA